jgi:hypothetical protein
MVSLVTWKRRDRSVTETRPSTSMEAMISWCRSVAYMASSSTVACVVVIAWW